jgi:prefoldin subunit 5
MSIKQQIKFKDEINFEEDQQDLVDKTASIQSLADQIQLLEGLLSRIEKSENNLKDLKKNMTDYLVK